MDTHETLPSAIFITRTEAARRLGVGVATIQHLIDSGVLEAVKFGYRTVRVRASTVTDLPSRLATTEHHERRPKAKARGTSTARRTQEAKADTGGSPTPVESPDHADDLTC